MRKFALSVSERRRPLLNKFLQHTVLLRVAVYVAANVSGGHLNPAGESPRLAGSTLQLGRTCASAREKALDILHTVSNIAHRQSPACKQGPYSANLTNDTTSSYVSIIIPCLLAVTVATLVTGHTSVSRGLAYITAQVAGAVFAAGLHVRISYQ